MYMYARLMYYTYRISDTTESANYNSDEPQTSTEGCTVCCQLDHPFHPDSSQIAHTQRQQGKQVRGVCCVWFEKFKWLTFCLRTNKVYCFYCRANSKSVPAARQKGDDAFTVQGFCNWKKATDKFKQHECSHFHINSCEDYHNSQQPSIISQLNVQLRNDQDQHRKALLKQLSLLKYLMRQGLATRGHIEDEGNLMQLLKSTAHNDTALKKWLEDGKYLSHEIINEQMQLMAHYVLRGMLSNIHKSKFFSVICDETQDVSCKEQLCISIRWVDDDYDIHEDLVGMHKVDTTDAETLVTVIKDCLIRCSLPLNNLHGQAYDGASNMAGKLTGVGKRILNDYPKAHFVHCMAHSLNLCIQDVGSNCTCIREALSVTSELAKVIRASPKRLALFEKIQLEIAPGSPKLKPLCPTRWTVRTEAINSVIKNFSVISSELEQLSQEGTGEIRSKACGLLALMEKFSVYFGLKLSHVVFAISEQLSTTLQSKDLTAQEAVKAVDMALEFFNRQRNNASFDDLYEQTVEESKNLTDPPALPRIRRVPKRIDSGSQAHTFASPKELYRKLYFEVIDIVINELRKRFQHPSFAMLQHMESLMLTSINGGKVNPSESFCSMYSEDIDIDKLKMQLSLLPDLLRTANNEMSGHGVPIRKVTSIRTVIDLMNSNTLTKSLLSQVDTLLRIYLTIPLSTSTAERAFSTLRRLKNYLRSTMTQERLNHAIILHTHKGMTDEIDLKQIATDFVNKNERRRNYFGQYD